MSSDRTDVLLIDDNPQDAELIAGALRRRMPGVVALTARDGAHAMEIIEGLPVTAWPRGVLLDLKMPRVDGFEVLRRLKGNAETSNIPVVVLTSSANGGDIQLAYSLGANSYIVKPMEFEDLTETLGRVAEYWLRINRGLWAGSKDGQRPQV